MSIKGLTSVEDGIDIAASLKAFEQLLQTEADLRLAGEKEYYNQVLANRRKLTEAEISELAKIYAKKKLLSAEEERARQDAINKAKADYDTIGDKIKELEQELVDISLSGTERLTDDIDSELAKLKSEAAEIKEKIEADTKKLEKDKKALEKAEKKAATKANAQADSDRQKEAKTKLNPLKTGEYGDFFTAISDMFTRKNADGARETTAGTVIGGAVSMADAIADKLSDFAKKLDNTINDIASNKSTIDTRLQGLNAATSDSGSYWEKMSSDITDIVGASSIVKQSDVVNNLKSMVGQGIAFNVEQRAFLATISSKIANTFNATDAALVRLVRIQQQDTTAGRLGMESALTSFLNNMYQTTEYMQQQANAIRQSIEEASALMDAKDAVAFEYQVQKWMGSLYSVGFSNTSNLSSALGKLAAGDITGISNGGTGNLLVMAANQAGLSISDLLTNGLDDTTTNQLLEAVVDYMAKLYDQASDSKVIQQQIANVYGLTASDLKAAANLASTTNNTMSSIYNKYLDYDTAITQLNNMANTMNKRTSTGELMTNAMSNFEYSLAAGIANNPILYATYTMASMLDSTVGGIALPDIKVLGTGVNLQTTVADLMRVGTLSASMLNGIGSLIGNMGNNSNNMLSKIGIGNGLTTVTRGNGNGTAATLVSGSSVSNSGYIGNEEDGVVKRSVMADAEEQQKESLVNAVEEDNSVTNDIINENIVNIYSLLRAVADGTTKLHVVSSTENSLGFN